MTRRYECLLLDVDDTLLDFKKCARGALYKTFQDFHSEGLFSEELFEIYHATSNALWEELNLGQINKQQIFERRFPTFFERAGLNLDPVLFEPAYRKNLCDQHAPVDNLMLVLPYLASGYRLYTASNGLKSAQIKRLHDSGIDAYLEDSFISEMIGYEKPDVRFFEAVFAKIGDVSKDRILMIGDSLSADIAGGNNAGIDTCYLNHSGEIPPKEYRITYEIRELKDLCSLL